MLEATAAGDRVGHIVVGGGIAKVEAGEPLRAVLVALSDLVELVLHRGGEVVIHQRVEVVLHQPDDRKRHPRRHQGVAAGHHVTAVLNGLDNRGVRRRAPDAEVLHLLDQAGLVVARRRVGGVAVGSDLHRGQDVSLAHLRQVRLVVLGIGVGAQPARERDRAAGGGELDLLARGRLARDRDLHRGAAGVFHLGGDGALPNQLVELELLGVERVGQLPGGGKALASRANRLVRLLGVLRLARIRARLRGDVVRAVELCGGRARRFQALGRQRGGVRTHVGDVAVFVQALRDTHRAGGGEVQLPARLLLQRRGHKRRVWPARIRLLLDVRNAHIPVFQPLGQRLGGGLVNHVHVRGLHAAAVVEVAALSNTARIDAHQLRIELASALQRRGEVPVLGGDKRHALALALDDDAGRHRLHAPRRQARHDLFPQHRADFVTVEAVQDTAGLLGVDQVVVELAGVLGRVADRGLGDLVKHHALDGDLRLERFQKVPGNRLALTVRVCGEQELVGLLQLGLEVRDLLLLVGADHVDRLEPVLRVDAQLRPGLVLVLRRDVGRAAGEITDVAHGGFDDEIVAQVLLDLLGLRRRLDDDEGLTVIRHAG